MAFHLHFKAFWFGTLGTVQNNLKYPPPWIKKNQVSNKPLDNRLWQCRITACALNIQQSTISNTKMTTANYYSNLGVPFFLMRATVLGRLWRHQQKQEPRRLKANTGWWRVPESCKLLCRHIISYGLNTSAPQNPTFHCRMCSTVCALRVSEQVMLT